MNDYGDFLEGRQRVNQPDGLAFPDPAPHLFDYQRAIVEWALRRGRAAIFSDTGSGKTAMQLEWARVVSAKGPVLILTPLAVAAQTVAEGKRFGVDCTYSRVPCDARITVANYEHLEKFDPSVFTGIVIDESSILKNYTGKFRNHVIEAFASTPYRLACTATPAPNDHMELGNHAEFLGAKSRIEMLAEYFVHDGGSTQNWRLKGHAEDAFWRFIASWAVMMRSPTDIGFEETYKLPPLTTHEHVIPIDHRDAWSEGFLFAPDAKTLNEQRATRRATEEKRVAKCAELAAGKDPALIWCELNTEGDAITAAIPDAVQVKGSDEPEEKIDRLLGFASGKYRVLVTKAKIAGFGMNYQHCAKLIFAGASHSFEQVYQAIRRCWRFGQTRPVDVHMIRAETEGAVIENYRRKEADAARMMAAMLEHMKGFQDVKGATSRSWNTYNPQVTANFPKWIGVDA